MIGSLHWVLDVTLVLAVVILFLRTNTLRDCVKHLQERELTKLTEQIPTNKQVH